MAVDYVDYEEGRALLDEYNRCYAILLGESEGSDLANEAAWRTHDARRNLEQFMLAHAEALLNPVSAAPSPALDEVERVATALAKLDGADFEKLGPITGRPLDNWRSWEPQARAAIAALRQRAAMDDLLRMDGELYDVPERAALSEEERARLEEVRAWLAANEASDASTSMDSLQAAYACDHLTELLSLIDKLTEVG